MDNEYVEHIYDISKLDDHYLNQHGYSNEDIQTLRDFDGNYKDLPQLSASIRLSASAKTLTFYE